MTWDVSTLGQMDFFIPNALEMHLITHHGIPAKALADARVWAAMNKRDYNEYLKVNLRLLASLWDDADDMSDCRWESDDSDA